MQEKLNQIVALKWLKRNMMKISKQLGIKSLDVEDVGAIGINRKWEV